MKFIYLAIAIFIGVFLEDDNISYIDTVGFICWILFILMSAFESIGESFFEGWQKSVKDIEERKTEGAKAYSIGVYEMDDIGRENGMEKGDIYILLRDTKENRNISKSLFIGNK